MYYLVYTVQIYRLTSFLLLDREIFPLLINELLHIHFCSVYTHNYMYIIQRVQTLHNVYIYMHYIQKALIIIVAIYRVGYEVEGIQILMVKCYNY